MGEILVVLLAVLLLFGSKSIPEFARTLGKGMNEFKKATDDLKKEFQDGTSGFREEINSIRSDIESEINKNSNVMHDMVDDIEHDFRDHLGTNSSVNNDVYGLNENPTEESSDIPTENVSADVNPEKPLEEEQELGNSE